MSNFLINLASKAIQINQYSTMRQLSLIIVTIVSLVGTLSFGQNICIGTDATICTGDQITLEDCANFGAGATGVPYSLTPIPYNPDPFNTPNTVSLSDDQFSQVINIGFNFCFYGNTYNQLVISSNNYVSFNLNNAGQYSPWSTTMVPNPGSTQTHNSILGPWQDIHPGLGGVISYAMYGVAPNRRFVVTWSNIPMFSCTGILYSSQIKLYETSNNLETHIVNKQICSTWNNGNAVHGVHSPLGADALTVPGRNNTPWSVANEGYLWTPQLGVQWEDTQGNTYPYTGPTLTVTPVPTPPSDSIGYFLSAIDNCGTGMGSSDTSWITVTQSAVTATMTPDICSSNIGTVTATTTSGTAPFTFNWPALGANTSTVNNVGAGTYTVNVTDVNGCPASASVTVTDTPAAFQGSTTVVSCPGGSDGTATAEMVPVLGTVSYQWDDPMNQTTQTAVGLTAGTYNCVITSTVGCQGTVTLNVTEIPGMIGVVDHTTDVTCNSGNDGTMEVVVNQGTPPYSYSWDNSSSTTNFADDLVAGVHTVTVTDANGCVITISGVIGEPPALNITFITPNTQICPEDDITLYASGAGGSSAYTFTWYEGGTQIGTGTSITVDPEFTNTQYCVELSEACGSPTDQECTLIYFPTPIEPNAVPEIAELCVPDTFRFVNTSTNPSEIATTFWEFGDNITHNTIENGADSTSHFYDIVGTYDITMTITSIYGCIYTDTLEDLITVLPSPVADFTLSDNPTTIFETTITAFDRSTHNVVDWQWYSPYSDPMTSSIENPTFQFPDGIIATYPITLIVTTEHGCVDTVTLNLDVVEDIIFYAPNAFTPDGDEFNQTWEFFVQGIDIFDFELQIYNRWGEVIWETHDPSVGWDGTYNGKYAQAGTYQWRAIVKSPYKDDRKVFTGSVSILK